MSDNGENKKEEEEEKKKDLPMVDFTDLFRYATTADMVLMGFGWLASVGAGGTQPMLMVLFGDMVSATSSSTFDIEALVEPLVWKMLIVAVIAMTLYTTAYFTIPFVAARQIKRIREEYFKATLRQDMEWFDNLPPGHLSVEFSETAHEIYKGIAQKMVEIVDASSQLLFGLSLAFYYSWKLALACAAGLPLLALSAMAMVKAGAADGVFGKEEYTTAGGIANEALAAIRTVQSFGGEVSTAARYEGKLDSARSAAIKAATKAGTAAGLMMACFTGLYSLGFGVGGELVRLDRINFIEDYPAPAGLLDSTLTSEWSDHAALVELLCLDGNGDPYTGDGLAICACDLPWSAMTDANGDAYETPQCGCGRGRVDTGTLIGSSSGCEDVGSILTAFFCFIFGGFTLGQIGPATEAIQKARVAAHKVYKVIDRVPTIDISVEGKKKFESTPEGNIEFKQVVFKYKKYDEEGKTSDARPVFAGLNLTIKAGETVALVGESGSGKSTIGRLLMRCYDPDEGQILVDGIDIRDLNPQELRSHIGLVSQEPLLFDKSIRENISYGTEGESTQEQIEDAATQANAHGFITSGQFPKGYETRVGPGGSKLSGGQKQRVSIARAILRAPPIMILDEATSALDTKSEAIVQKALNKLIGGKQRTTIVIAHRLTTVKKADRIIVLGSAAPPLQGTVIKEQGTHEELLLKKGLYYALVGGQNAAAKMSEESKSIKVEDDEKKVVLSPSQENLAKLADEEEEKKTEIYEVPSSRVWAYSTGPDGKPSWVLVGLGLLSAALNGAIQPTIALIFSEMLTTFTNYDPDSMQTGLIIWSLFFVGLAVFQCIVHFGQVVFMTIVGERITTNLRGAAFRAMLRQDISFFDDSKNSVGALTAQLGSDAARVQLTAGQSLGATFNALCAVAFGFAIAFVESWKIAVVVLGGVPVIGFANFLMMQILASGEAGVQDLMIEAGGMMNEAVTNMREVQAFALQPKMAAVMSELLEKPLRIQKGLAMKGGLSFGFVQAAFFGFYAVAFWWGGKVITNDENVSFENFMKCLFALAFAAMGAGQAATFAGDQAKAIAAKSRLFKLIDRVPPIDTKPWNDATVTDSSPREFGENIIPSDEFKGQITLNEVNFAYPTRPDAKVFNKTSISIPAGKTVALVGTSGSGKSTAIQLLERFYDPLVETKEGGDAPAVAVAQEKLSSPPANSVTIDGYDLRALDLKWLRSQVGLVGQEPVLFYGSVAENIASGKPNATQEEIEAAAKAANAHDFIMETGGYERNVGIRGGKLSGGQKQRVAIARAIIKNPKILLLDEATSALDNESEEIVQKSLDALIKDSKTPRTTVVIAHRLTTIKDADLIYVLDNDGSGARIVEVGNHQELMEKEGVYKKLYDAFTQNH